MKLRGLRRLRHGELIALAGALGIAVSLALGWYSSPTGTITAWGSFGPAVVLLLLAGIAALLLAVVTILERSTAIPMATLVGTTWLGLAAVIAAIVRLLERPDHASGLLAGGWLALAGALAVLVGGWLGMRDERTDAYEPRAVESSPPPAPVE